MGNQLFPVGHAIGPDLLADTGLENLLSPAPPHPQQAFQRLR